MKRATSLQLVMTLAVMCATSCATPAPTQPQALMSSSVFELTHGGTPWGDVFAELEQLDFHDTNTAILYGAFRHALEAAELEQPRRELDRYVQKRAARELDPTTYSGWFDRYEQSTALDPRKTQAHELSKFLCRGNPSPCSREISAYHAGLLERPTSAQLRAETLALHRVSLFNHHNLPAHAKAALTKLPSSRVQVYAMLETSARFAESGQRELAERTRDEARAMIAEAPEPYGWAHLAIIARWLGDEEEEFECLARELDRLEHDEKNPKAIAEAALEYGLYAAFIKQRFELATRAYAISRRASARAPDWENAHALSWLEGAIAFNNHDIPTLVRLIPLNKQIPTTFMSAIAQKDPATLSKWIEDYSDDANSVRYRAALAARIYRESQRDTEARTRAETLLESLIQELDDLRTGELDSSANLAKAYIELDRLAHLITPSPQLDFDRTRAVLGTFEYSNHVNEFATRVTLADALIEEGRQQDAVTFMEQNPASWTWILAGKVYFDVLMDEFYSSSHTQTWFAWMLRTCMNSTSCSDQHMAVISLSDISENQNPMLLGLHLELIDEIEPVGASEQLVLELFAQLPKALCYDTCVPIVEKTALRHTNTEIILIALHIMVESVFAEPNGEERVMKLYAKLQTFEQRATIAHTIIEQANKNSVTLSRATLDTLLETTRLTEHQTSSHALIALARHDECSGLEQTRGLRPPLDTTNVELLGELCSAHASDETRFGLFDQLLDRDARIRAKIRWIYWHATPTSRTMN